MDFGTFESYRQKLTYSHGIHVCLEITHFGQEYTHQEIDADQSSTARTARDGRSADKTRRSYEPVSREVLEGLYRHYWLDFVLLGYDIPDGLI